MADVASVNPITSRYGTVSQGTTQNLVAVSDIEFLIYEEDGVFATECEPNASYPSYRPIHPLCQTAHLRVLIKLFYVPAQIKALHF